MFQTVQYVYADIRKTTNKSIGKTVWTRITVMEDG